MAGRAVTDGYPIVIASRRSFRNWADTTGE